jgi:signal transduction histidine kinase
MYKIHITPEIYILAAQLALIVFLMIQTFRHRKLELQLRELNHYFIETQEEERKHIARELHDDLGQRLALVKLDLERAVHEDLSLKESSRQARWKDILAGIEELGSDIQHLSHTLHSSKLRYLGLKPALKELCGNFQRQHQIKIDLQIDGFTKAASREVELCVYRVAQEALQNIAKHSGADCAVFKLANDGNMLQMEISDNGRGFTQAEIFQPRGLGLASMRERLSIMDGDLQIKSAPGRGTILSAQVPLESVHSSHSIA